SLAVPNQALCAPESWITPAKTAAGTANERFGAALACSDAAGSPAQSFIAIGAPNYSGGSGAVYIFNPDDTTSPLQSITSPSAGANKHFGGALAFINDSNGDGRKELAIGEPNESGAGGTVYIYYSTGDPAAPFSLCGSQPGPQGFGGSLLGLTFSGMVSSLLIVGAPESRQTTSLAVQPFGGGCLLSSSSQFESTGPASSRWGHSLGETPMGATSDLLVGAPLATSMAGVIASVDSSNTSTDRYTGIGADTYGFSVASHSSSTLFAFTAPAIDTIFVKRNVTGTYSNWCSISAPLSDISVDSSRSLAQLNGMFATSLALSLAPYSAFASYRTESETGGSVALFGVQAPSSCGSIRQINNCLYDPDQQQGFAIAGGDDCKISRDGTSRSLMLVGAPQAGDGGRVDLYVEGDELGAPLACSTPTPTPTPTDTPVPPATATPLPTGTVDAPEVRVAPGSGALPAPKLELRGASALTIQFPRITYAKNFYQRIANLLKISIAKALRLKIETYFVATVTTSSRSDKRGASLTLKALSDQEPSLTAQNSPSRTGATNRTVATIRTRRDNVTLSRLSPGRRYTVSYKVEFRIASPSKVFNTRTSGSASIQVP
ncbi:MAG: integrin alpha, partial [Pseudomonadota bacterium]